MNKCNNEFVTCFTNVLLSVFLLQPPSSPFKMAGEAPQQHPGAPRSAHAGRSTAAYAEGPRERGSPGTNQGLQSGDPKRYKLVYTPKEYYSTIGLSTINHSEIKL